MTNFQIQKALYMYGVEPVTIKACQTVHFLPSAMLTNLTIAFQFIQAVSKDSTVLSTGCHKGAAVPKILNGTPSAAKCEKEKHLLALQTFEKGSCSQNRMCNKVFKQISAH